MSSPPVALTLAGSDSSAGAGLQADLKTFAAHGVYGVCAVSALVAEVPGEVVRVSPVDPTLFEAQLKGVVSAFPVAAAKTGMLATAENVAVAAAFAQSHPDIPLVVDPVLRAGSGSALLTPEGFREMKHRLLPLARLITPNRPEAESLLDTSILTSGDFAAAPRRLHELYGCNVLLKGGHFADDSPEVCDHAWIDGEARVFSRPRLAVPDVHGTGCVLSAAITAQLALGHDLGAAIDRATAYLAAALARHHVWRRGEGFIEALNAFPDGVDFTRP